ncbi:MAG: pilus assembly protein [Candidatus Devosia phytovorans]|uniref:Pilus assembly protein n=1 Tax=Candidatus Devosia phytovorans TaxID=3121372 RepID=A0AAJ5VSS9_9HYPH|nr:TadE/TadG family type IV pilus assembly protein [Devosia sp.]WEK03240.1 MAG: pilus assembly protein [Devosia sp.]
MVPLTTLLQRFLHDTGGNVAIITAVAILPMIIIAGGATDVARHEAYRVELQDGVDRAVLAAASLTQTRSIEQTVNDYIATLPYSDKITLSFTNRSSINSREVSVSASYTMETAFLPLLGINTLIVNAAGTALEKKSNIELSVMLDISGSMAGNKYTNLKSAATSFVRTMLTNETKAYTSMTLVPYAGQVNVGRMVFDGLGGARQHANSSCFNLNNTDYASGFRNFNGRSQVPEFTRWNSSTDKPTLNASMDPGWCPGEETSISYFSNDADLLAARISGYRMGDGTGSAIAMNYGLMLLDPTAQPLVAQAASVGMVPAAFSNRPAAFTDPNTLKVLVLMTDGAITEQYTAKEPGKSPRLPNNWKDYQDPITNVKETGTVTKQYLSKVCAAAKGKGVVVYTIGFQLSNSGGDLTMKNDLRNCASSTSHYYDVSSLDIASAFQSIATSIQKIRLTN